jgi:hypothetical protein
MGDSFDAQRRYFQVQLERCLKKPGLHKNKTADLKLYLKALEEAGSPAAFKRYVQKTGNMVSTGKAEARDRYENRAFIYEKLGQARKVQADRQRVEIIEKAETHRELAENLESFERESDLEFQENKAIGAVVSILKAVFHLATDPKGSGDRKRNIINFNTYWKQMKEAYPESSWSGLLSYKPYRDRIIFTDKQMATLKKVLEAVKHGR